MPATVGAAVQVGTEIAKTISAISDQVKRRKFEQALALLTNAQQRQLNEELAATQDMNEKIAILSNSLTQYLIANANAASKKDTILYIVAGAMALGLLITVIVIKRKR